MGATSPGVTNAGLAGMSALQATGTLAQTYAQVQAQKAQAQYQKQVMESNIRMANIQGKDAVRRGDRDSSRAISYSKKVRGAQRAAMAAQGIDVNSGSALDIQDETAAMGELDALTAKNNAWREAWGYKVQALDYGAKGQLMAEAARNESRNTMLTGGLQALRYGAEAYGYANDYRVKRRGEY